jgi:hypothetical protein
MEPAVTMPDAALFPKQLSERTATGKSAMAFSQGHIDSQPSDSQCTWNPPAICMRPLARAFMPRINPGEDLPNRKFW